MEESETHVMNKQCFRLKHKIKSKLNVVFNPSNSMMLLWNQSQIFIFENLEFNEPTIKFDLEFETKAVMLTSKYLLCLDSNGMLQGTSLKFKKTLPKRLKSSFCPQAENIVTCLHVNQDDLFSIKLENSLLYLYVNKLTPDFPLQNKVVLIYNFSIPSLEVMKDKSIMKCFQLSDKHSYLNKALNKSIINGSILVLLSLDGYNIYYYIYNPQTEQNCILKPIYSCPSELSNICISDNADLSLIVSLKSGSIIKLCLENKSVNVVHMNIAINKFIAFNDTIIYTDGSTIWKCDKPFLADHIKIIQYYVKFPNDFLKYGDNLICITYSNLIYLFDYDDKTACVREDNSEYHSAEKVLQKSKQFKLISEELRKCRNIVSEAYVETNYLSAMALANRQDIMNTVIDYKVVVYEYYNEVTKDNKDVILSSEISEYFNPNTWIFIVKINVKDVHKLNSILLLLIQDLKLHITLISNQKILKTVSLSIKELFRHMVVAVPFRSQEIVNVTVQIKIVPGIPGSLDRKQKTWIILSKAEIHLGSEHFIKNMECARTVTCTKELRGKIDDHVLRAAKMYHETTYNIIDISSSKVFGKEFDFFIKLPDDYIQKISNRHSYTKHLNRFKSEFIYNKLYCDEFLKAKDEVIFQIQSTKVKVQIINDVVCGNLLKVSSHNPVVALDIREFFSNLVYGFNDNLRCGAVMVPQEHYAVVEELQRSLHAYKSNYNENALNNLIDQFQKDILCMLP